MEKKSVLYLERFKTKKIIFVGMKNI